MVKANTTTLDQTGAPSDPGVHCDCTDGTQEKPALGSTLLGIGSIAATLIQKNLNAAPAAIMLEMKSQTCIRFKVFTSDLTLLSRA